MCILYIYIQYKNVYIPSYPKTVKIVGFDVKPEVWKVNPMFWIMAVLGSLTLLHPAASKSAISSPTPAMLSMASATLVQIPERLVFQEWVLRR